MVTFLLSDGKSRGFHIDPSLLQKMQRGMLLKGTEGEHRDEELFQKYSETPRTSRCIDLKPYVISSFTDWSLSRKN